MSDSKAVEAVGPADELARLGIELARAQSEAAELAAQVEPTGVALVSAATNLPADTMKTAMATHRAALIKKTRQVKDLQERMRRALDRQLAEANAVLEPLREQVRRLEEGIWAIQLYTGRDEEIVALAGGEAAPASEPLVIRQAVLAMDEETAALAAEGGIDYADIDLFDEWVRDPAHLAQVAPEARCVVVLRPRRTEKEYGDPMLDVAANAANRRSYWLIRNGQRLYRMTTAIDVGARLVPRRDEFTSLFRVRRHNPATGADDWVDLEPGSDAWMKAEAAQDARSRHYMRIALVLQGLMDRTTCLHPLPGGSPFSLLHPEAYEDGRVVLVTDDENSIGTGRTPFYQWLAERNAGLRPGMRIIGAFNTREWRHANEYERRPGHSRLSPDNAEAPRNETIYRLDGWKDLRGERYLTFHYPRTRPEWLRDRYGNHEYRVPKTRAAAMISPLDRFIIPLDLVSIEEMRAYLSARSDRHAYSVMMPLLHAAIAAKTAEAELEAPFRLLLAGEVAKAHQVDIDAASAAVGPLIDRWKLANRWHRPLVSSKLSPDGADKATEAKAIKAIIADFGRDRAAVAGGDETAALRRLLETDPTIMYVGRARNGSYRAYAPMVRRFGPQAAPERVWVREYRIGGSTGTAAITSRDWVLPGVSPNRLRALHSTDMFETWDLTASAAEHLTDDELHAGAEAAVAAVATTFDPSSEPLLAVTHDATNRTFEIWTVPEASHHRNAIPAVGFRATMSVNIRRVEWTRKAGSPSTLTPWRHPHSTRWHARDEVPWGAVWDGRSRRRAAVIVEETTMAEANLSRARFTELERLSRGLDNQVNKALDAVAEGWRAEAEAAAYARFIDDYADPDLWEGHRKTLNLTYPYGGRRSDQPLYATFSAVVNAGLPLTGTVADVWAVATTSGLTVKAGPPESIAHLSVDTSGPSGN